MLRVARKREYNFKIPSCNKVPLKMTLEIFHLLAVNLNVKMPFFDFIIMIIFLL